jgi:uncharacterized integral membrane protein (TIGR00698 family)
MIKQRLSQTLFGTDRLLLVLPGTLVAIAVMLLSALLARYLGALAARLLGLQSSPISTFLVAIVLGVLLGNTVRFPARWEIGFAFCLRKLLRAGIILMGIRLSIVAVARIGLVSALVVVVCIAFGMVLPVMLAKAFGVSSRLATLIAAGTSICGVSAIVATSPTIGASEEETTYAISTITVFGLLATVAYPYLVELSFHLQTAQAGVFLGTAVHDTSQVTGAAYIYDQIWQARASGVAVTTKLVRNTLMVVVIPVLALFSTRNAGTDKRAPLRAGRLFPGFVIGFLAFAAFRTIGDLLVSRGGEPFLLWSSDTWPLFREQAQQVAALLLATAIAAAGLGTRLDRLKRLSLRPLLLGLFAAIIVGLVSLTLVKLLGGPIGRLSPP